MKRANDENGAAMVEFAIVVSMLLVLLVGIIEFGRAYNTQISIQAAAREGARELALRHTGIEGTVADAAPSVDGLAVTIVESCPETGDGKAHVRVSTDFTFGIPFVPLGSTTLSADGVMRCGL